MPGLVHTLLAVAVIEALAIGGLLLTSAQDSRATHTKPPQMQALSAPKFIAPSELD